MTSPEIILNGETYVLKSSLKRKKEFSLSTQLKMLPIMEELGYSPVTEILNPNPEEVKTIAITDPANVFMIEGLSEEAREFLLRFADKCNLKTDYTWEKFWTKEPENSLDLQRFTYSHEFIQNAFKFLNITSDATSIKMKPYAFPIILENLHFRIVLAPRVDMGNDSKLYGVKE